MADNTLNIEIKAEVDNLTKGLGKADRKIRGFEKSVDKTIQPINKMGKEVKVNAVPAVTEFSRVIQDAPFGIIGVANNIQQLTSNFGDLSRNAGGSKNALKAMLATSAGPSGILLAVSAITTLLVSYRKEIAAFGDDTLKASLAQDKINKSFDDYVSKLVGVKKARADGALGAQKELLNLKLLKKQLDNTSLSQEDRLKAYNELIKRYPSYFKEITAEDALVGGLSKKYNTLATEILKSAKAKAASEQLSKNLGQQLLLEQKLTEAKEKALKVEAEVKKAREDDSFFKNTSKGSEFRNVAEESKINEIANQLNNLKRQSKGLTDFISKQGGIIPLDFGTGKGSSEKVKKDLGIFADTFKNELSNTSFKAKSAILEFQNSFDENLSGKKSFFSGKDLINFSETGNELKQGFSTFLPVIKDGITGLTETITPDAKKLIDTIIPPKKDIESRSEELKQALLKLNEGASEIINGGLAQTFAGLGSAIGQGLASGGNVLESLGASLLGSLGSILVQLGKLAIATGIGLKKIKLSLASLNPAVAIGAGIALVALGSAFSAKASAISSNIGASGGGGGGDFSSAGTNQSFSSTPNIASSGTSGGNFVFEIAGTKLIGVLKNTLDRNKALGGQNNLLFN